MKYKEAVAKLRYTFDEVLKKQPEVFTISTIGYMLFTMEDEPKEMDILRNQMIKLLRKYIHSSMPIRLTPNQTRD